MTFTQMKDSGIAWVREIPSSWDVKPNKYVMTKKKRICPLYKGEPILSLTMNGVVVRDLDNLTGKRPASFDGYQRIQKGNLLMCLFDIDVTPRCIGLITQDGLTSPAYSQFCMTDKAVVNYYYYYYLLLDYTKELLHLAKNLRHSFTEDQLGAIKVPVPPVSEQQRIADYLDKKCAEIDTLSNSIQKQIDTLEQYKRAVITETVTKGLNPSVPMKDSGIPWIGKVPESWEILPNKYVMHKEKQICPLYNGEPILSLSMDGVLIRDIENPSGKMPASFDGYQKIKAGNLLMCLFDMDVTPRCIGLIKNTGLTSPAYSQFVLHENALAEYFYYYYLSLDFTKELVHLAKNLRHALTEDVLGTIKVPVPPKSEQQAIANYLDDKCGKIDAIIQGKQQQLEKLEQYKKATIFEYVTGKKQVPEV